MVQNFWDLCDITEINQILSSTGSLSHVSIQSTTCACPVCTFLATSCWSCATASGEVTEMCGPLSIAACICSQLHGFPVCTGQLLVAYGSRVSHAGWANPNPERALCSTCPRTTISQYECANSVVSLVVTTLSQCFWPYFLFEG